VLGGLPGADGAPRYPARAAAAASTSSVLVLHAADKGHARRVAEAIFESYTSLFGLKTPAQRAEAADELRAERRQKERRALLRRLRKLVADPEAVRRLRVPAGVVDGFIAAEREKRVE
jgi:hypothetical protein